MHSDTVPKNVNMYYRKPTHGVEKKKQTVLVFDENTRREFLTGFHKRKVQRKTKAAEELKRQLKVERKKIKFQTKKVYEKFLDSQNVLANTDQPITKELDIGTHTVNVTELSPTILAHKCNWIGINQVVNNKNAAQLEGSYCETKTVAIEGMDTDPLVIKTDGDRIVEAKTTKEFKKALKEQATKQVKMSKVFKRKSRKAQIKNTKRKRREERRMNCNNKKSKRIKHTKR